MKRLIAAAGLTVILAGVSRRKLGGRPHIGKGKPLSQTLGWVLIGVVTPIKT